MTIAYRFQAPGDAPFGTVMNCRVVKINRTKKLRTAVCKPDGDDYHLYVCFFAPGDPNFPALGERGTLTFTKTEHGAFWKYRKVTEATPQ